MKINTVAIATKHKLKPFSMRVMQSSRLTFFWTLPANEKTKMNMRHRADEAIQIFLVM